MKGNWGSVKFGDRYSAPVEMRFIDMFMAALGALIFMAMLLAFLIQYLPHNGQMTPIAMELQKHDPLTLLTHSLPPGQAGEPYELALAYRGGAGQISWQIIAGKREIPDGLSFDEQRGILSGTPKHPGTFRFVLRVQDSSGLVDERPYTLTVLAPKRGSHSYERWLASAFIILACLIWIFIKGIQVTLSTEIATLREAYSQGRSSYETTKGFKVVERVELPEGIDTKVVELFGIRQFGRYWITGTALLSSFLIWLYWLH